jgi:dolichol kinase
MVSLGQRIQCVFITYSIKIKIIIFTRNNLMKVTDFFNQFILPFVAVIGVQYIVCFLFRSPNNTINKSKEDLCIPRKIQHILTGVVLTYFNYILNYYVAVTCISGGVLLILTVDILRHRNENFNNYVINEFGPILRKEEKSGKYLGSTYFLMGVWIAVTFCNKIIASLAILYLGFGDPVASLAGLIVKSNDIIKGKSWTGLIACWLLCALVTQLFYVIIGQEVSITTSILCGLVAAISELLTGFVDIDDNVLIPAFSGFLLTIVNLIKLI